MTAKRKPYQGTEVAVEKSREGIAKILRRWGAHALQARLRLVARPPGKRGQRGQLRSPEALEKLREAERRRLHRVAFHWLKGQADAIEAGLFDPATVMLPFLEGGDGRTVAEAVQPMLAQLGHGMLALAPASGGS